ncbi:H-NS histone family protein [Maritimibacter sp. DP07]|uniref:H-NS histone family protein n=1 Tax=Maritimibacter harenae TaxID=2606218 RepID=A0A845M6S7_9RHOB|nr:H-NS histone family protein [Maritimibacter harenae]MZR14268.1 H-NS histone family protein [Maritimibacter harenae]
MKPNLKKMNRKELEKLKVDIDKALSRVEEEEKKAARLAAEKAAKAMGYSLEDLSDVKPAKRAPKKKDARTKVAPKFANPNAPEQTWTGRGRKPKWVEAHLEAGGTLEDIEIKKNEQPPAS